MSITMTTSNHYKYQLGKKLIDLDTDTIKAILMNGDFTFDKDAHATLSDVTGGSPEYQIDAGNGYTQNDKVVSQSSPCLVEDDANDRAIASFEDISWTATGGSIGPFLSIILYDDDTPDDTVIGCVTLDEAVTITAGNTHSITNIQIAIT